MLITVEGLDGAGKTTLIAGLAEHLPDAVVLREPGGVRLAEDIRALVKDPAQTVSPRAEALLYAAARAQLVEERVRPELEAGRTVLLDRFVDSSLAYQGAGRGLGVAAVRCINEFGTGGLVPDRTLYLRISAEARAERLRARGGELDRLEREPEGFFRTIALAYDRLAAEAPGRIRVLDADLAPDVLLEAALQALE